LFELEELPVADVAEVLGIPIGTVGSRFASSGQDFTTAFAASKAMSQHRGGAR